MAKTAPGASRVTRRFLLKGASAIAGAAVGSSAINGFPTIWAQDIKDITLRHVGVSYSVVQAIGDQASKDLGFKVAMQNLDTSTAITRFITPGAIARDRRRGRQAVVAGNLAAERPGPAAPAELLPLRRG